MALELSGTLNTTSPRGAGCSRASCRPSSRRARSTDSPKTVLSGRAKYTSSNTQRLTGRGDEPRQLGDLAVLDPDELARLELAGDVRAQQVEGAGLRRHAPSRRRGGPSPAAGSPGCPPRRRASARRRSPGCRRRPPARARPGSGPRPWRPCERAIRCTSTSVSDEVVKIAPFSTSSRLSSAALMMLPLWAMASGPQRVATLHGCALASTVLPVVE